jgi:hypothetical protein
MSPRGNRSSAALIEARRTRLLQLKQEGKTIIEAEEILQGEGFPADRVTLWRDLKGMMVKFEASNSQAYLQLKQEQDTILRRMEELLVTEQVDPEVAREWRAIRKDISELWGLDAPNKSVTAHIDADIDPAKLVGYRKFLYHTRHLSEADVNAKVFPYCDSLPPSGTPQYLLEPSEDMK